MSSIQVLRTEDLGPQFPWQVGHDGRVACRELMVNAQELTTLVTGTRKLIALSETGFTLFEFPIAIDIFIYTYTYITYIYIYICNYTYIKGTCGNKHGLSHES